MMRIRVTVLVVTAVLAGGGVPAQVVVQEVDGLGGMFGKQVAGVGDLDLDGYDDYAIGAPWANDDGGSVDVISGRTGEVLYFLPGEDRFGEAVQRAGDVNADGVPDFVVGASNASLLNLNSGVVTVHSGVDASVLWTFVDTDPRNHFGTAVAGAGDVDADGYDDLIVGANQFGQFGEGTGFARVYSGQHGEELFTARGIAPVDRLGSSVGPAGDLDEDGYADVIIGARQFVVGTGYAVIVSGKEALEFTANAGDTNITFSEELLASDVIPRFFVGVEAGSEFGASVAMVGDVTGDDVPEYAVGAPLQNDTGDESGRVTVFNGANASIHFAASGLGAGDQLGFSVSAGQDVDGDGVPDVIAGAREAVNVGFLTETTTGNGYARIISGQSGMTSQVDGTSFGSLFGWSVAIVGDVDGDGVSEVGVGSPTDDGAGFNAGKVYVYSLNAFATMGTGCAGSGGFVPDLRVDGNLHFGEDSELVLSEGLGGSVALFSFGLGESTIPLAGGCTLHVLPTLGLEGVLLEGFGPGQGTCTLPFLPADSGLAGLEPSAQAFVIDHAMPQEFSATPGVVVTPP